MYYRMLLPILIHASSILIHALPILIQWLGFRLSTPYLKRYIAYLDTLREFLTPCLNTLNQHESAAKNTLGSRHQIRIDSYKNRVISQSESSITWLESSRRLGVPSRLSARVGSLWPLLIHGDLHPPPDQLTLLLLSGVFTRVMDTSVYQVSDPGWFRILLGGEYSEVDAVITPRNDKLFLPTAFEDLEIGGSAENPILLDDEKDKANPFPTKPVWERPTWPLELLRICPFGTRKHNVPLNVYRNRFQ